MPKRILAFFLALALCAPMLGGCARQPDDSTMIDPPGRAPDESAAPRAGASSAVQREPDAPCPEPGAASSDPAQTASADPSAEWMTRLVNAEHPLPEDFTVETAAIRGYDERLFDRRAAPMLQAMLDDAEKAGCKLYLVSAYRSVKRQTALFSRKTNSFLAEGLPREEAERQAALWVARPGTSEHNTGLAADIVSADWYAHHDDLTAEFENTPEFEWLMAHCAEYGFILRYPKGGQDITGVVYEPWHYRFVGRQAARSIMSKGITLEEWNGFTR